METISQSEAARRAGISRAAIQKHLKVGRIKPAGKNKVELASFTTWLANRMEQNHEPIKMVEQTIEVSGLPKEQHTEPEKKDPVKARKEFVKGFL